MTSKAVAKTTDLTPIQQTAAMLSTATPAVASNEFGIGAGDLRIETLLLMQPASSMVSEGKTKLGDIVRNESEKIIASMGGAIEVVPLYKYETWRMYQATDGKFVKEIEYKSNVKVEKEGEEETPNGRVLVRRYHTLNWFFILTSDLAQGEFFPVLMRLKSSSFKAGSVLASFLYKRGFFNKKPFDYAVKLGIDRDKNEKNQHWALMTFKEANVRETTLEERAIGEVMARNIVAKRYEIVETPDSDEVSSTPHAAKPVVMGAEIVGSAQGEY